VNASFPFYGEMQTAERWDGIGGEMMLGRQRQAGVGKPHGPGAPKKAVSRGSSKLNAAAGKALEKHSDEIVKSLYDSTINGNVISAKLLFALAEGQIDCEDEALVLRLFSYAEKLASEPEWDGETNEAAALIGMEER
jgi:hypothetical protein